jgi:hypothetical protein
MQYGHQAWFSKAAGKQARDNDDGISVDRIPLSLSLRTHTSSQRIDEVTKTLYKHCQHRV